MPLRTIEEIRNEFSIRGIPVSEWARNEGFSPGLVHQVLSGRSKCVRGESHEIAVVLGLKNGKSGRMNDLPFSRSSVMESEDDDLINIR